MQAHTTSRTCREAGDGRGQQHLPPTGLSAGDAEVLPGRVSRDAVNRMGAPQGTVSRHMPSRQADGDRKAGFFSHPHPHKQR
jgi:hypothetical protein